MSDKRRCHRLHIELPATFKISEKDEEISLGTTLDVSALGLCLLTKEVLKVGQELALQLILPRGEKIRLQVKVVWVKETDFYGIEDEFMAGIKILEPFRADEVKFIKFFVKELLKSPPLP